MNFFILFRTANIQIFPDTTATEQEEEFGHFFNTGKWLRISVVFLVIFRGFSRNFEFFQWLKMQHIENQTIKGVKRGNFPFFPNEDPRPPYGAKRPRPFKAYRNMLGGGQQNSSSSDGNAEEKRDVR